MLTTSTGTPAPTARPSTPPPSSQSVVTLSTLPAFTVTPISSPHFSTSTGLGYSSSTQIKCCYVNETEEYYAPGTERLTAARGRRGLAGRGSAAAAEALGGRLQLAEAVSQAEVGRGLPLVASSGTCWAPWWPALPGRDEDWLALPSQGR